MTVSWIAPYHSCHSMSQQNDFTTPTHDHFSTYTLRLYEHTTCLKSWQQAENHFQVDWKSKTLWPFVGYNEDFQSYLLISVLVAQTFCDTNNPCLNGGHCSSNIDSPTQYTCDCGDWFRGRNCEGITFLCVLVSVFALASFDPGRCYFPTARSKWSTLHQINW